MQLFPTWEHEDVGHRGQSKSTVNVRDILAFTDRGLYGDQHVYRPLQCKVQKCSGRPGGQQARELARYQIGS